jgi:hypothetical protein
VKCALDNISGRITGSEYSHGSSWAHLRANQLRHLGFTDLTVLDGPEKPHTTDWSGYDVVFLYHGINFKPTKPGNVPVLNIFDGKVENAAKYYERLIYPQHSGIRFISLDWPMPDYGYMCSVKKGVSDAYWDAVDWKSISDKCKSITEWTNEPAGYFGGSAKVSKLHMGDSHCHSAYKPDSTGATAVIRKDGRTLAGVLRKRLVQECSDFGINCNNLESITLYYGNIDIRHHILRSTDPKGDVKRLLGEFEIQSLQIGSNIELVCPLPIEDESRKLPKTGWYDGTPFFGSQTERMEIVRYWIDELKRIRDRNKWDLFEWPKYWYEIDGLEFMQTYMERPKSIHLARKFYRWDLVNDVPNPNLIAPKSKTLLEF